jgi:hypothetical protein
MKQFNQRKGESDNDFRGRLYDIFAEEEKGMLAFFKKYPHTEPDGSFLLRIFLLGWNKAKRKFSPKK